MKLLLDTHTLLSVPYAAFMTRAITGYGLTVLPMTFDDGAAYKQLPFPEEQHRDPFDCQRHCERVT